MENFQYMLPYIYINQTKEEYMNYETHTQPAAVREQLRNPRVIQFWG